jgi:hypothetical protein
MRYLPFLLLAACGSDHAETIGGGGATPCGGPIASVLAAIASSSAEATSSASSSSAGQGGGSSPSATSSGGGDGGAGTDGCGCPGNIVERSGSRLEVLSARSAEGAAIVVGLYDTALAWECAPEMRPDGVVRCVPAPGAPGWTDEDLVVMEIVAGAP